MKIEEFQQRLENTVLVADGAVGTMLFEAVSMQRSFEELNLTQPEAVFRVHQAYIQAGAQIIETNTFGANRSKLGPLSLADKVTAINHRGVKMAREARDAAPHEVLIAGSIGPVSVAPVSGELPREEILAAYREQASALEERGVDFFILETFSNLEVLLLAVEAIRSGSALPIVAQMTFSEEGTTQGGMLTRDAATRMAAVAVQAIGTNCTLGPQSMLPILGAMATRGVRLGHANAGCRSEWATAWCSALVAGIPRYSRVGRRWGAHRYTRHSPEHIRAMARPCGRPARRWPEDGGRAGGRAEGSAAAAQRTRKQAVAQDAGGKFVLSVEMIRPRVRARTRVQQVDRSWPPAVWIHRHQQRLNGSCRHGRHDGGRALARGIETFLI